MVPAGSEPICTCCVMSANEPAGAPKLTVPGATVKVAWATEKVTPMSIGELLVSGEETAMGGRMKNLPQPDGAKAIANGGVIIHEVGGAIMGADRAKSVTNPWCQTWDVPNLYMTDGSCHCSSPDKNPTITIMALAWRAGEHMLAEMKRGAF